MPVPTSPLLVASLLRPLDSALIGGRQKNEWSSAALPVQVKPEAEPLSARPALPTETQPGLEFKAIVRANLHAAAQHVTRGHKARSFRECSHPSCRNASNLIPYPVVIEPDVTDADLEAIFQRVVTAALEEVAAHPVPAETAIDWWEKPHSSPEDRRTAARLH